MSWIQDLDVIRKMNAWNLENFSTFRSSFWRYLVRPWRWLSKDTSTFGRWHLPPFFHSPMMVSWFLPPSPLELLLSGTCNTQSLRWCNLLILRFQIYQVLGPWVDTIWLTKLQRITSRYMYICWNNSYDTWIVKLWRSWAIYSSGQDARAKRTMIQSHRITTISAW